MTVVASGDRERATHRVFVSLDNGDSMMFYCRGKPRVSYWEHTVNLRIEKKRTVVLSLFHVEFYEVEKLGKTPRNLAGLKTNLVMVIEKERP